MREVTVYECEHCNKRKYAYKASAKRHENKCYWNPKTKSCMTCKHYICPDESTEFQVYEEETFCAFANPYFQLNYNCKGWIEYAPNDDCGV